MVDRLVSCVGCGKQVPFSTLDFGFCEACMGKRRPPSTTNTIVAEARNRVILTTETAAADLVIAERLGIVAAECALGMNLFKDLFALGRDVIGGRSRSVQDALAEARKTALAEIQRQAADLGADAVVAMDLDYSEISGGGKSMLLLVASGTAVRLAKRPEA